MKNDADAVCHFLASLLDAWAVSNIVSDLISSGVELDHSLLTMRRLLGSSTICW
jgi:hypothetical protein